MRHFVGFRRICAVLQPEDEELKRREWKRTFEDGKLVCVVGLTRLFPMLRSQCTRNKP
jgi:hypothetical protein